MGYIRLEYIWVGGKNELRSKTKVIQTDKLNLSNIFAKK